jgi:hypothetical protein
MNQAGAVKITGGFIEFAIGEKIYYHFLDKFSNKFDLSELENYVRSGKEHTGMKRFIRAYFVPADFPGQTIPDEDIQIFNHEFEFSHH